MWTKAIIAPNITVKEALQVINDNAYRAAFVLDNGKLIGMVTDGDIRRGLLKNIGLDDEVSKIMNRSPIFCYQEDVSPQNIKEILIKHRFLHVPIVDNNHHLVNVLTYDSFLQTKKLDNPVFIMAGGFGTRLKPLTDNCPKPMLRIGDKPILERIMLHLKKCGFYNFYFSTHYLAEQITDYFGNGEQWGVSIKYVYEEQPLGTGGALSLLPDELNLPLIVTNGDVMTKVDFAQLLSFHNDHESCATVAVREYYHQVPFGVIEIDGHYIKGMVEKPRNHSFVNAGIYVLQPEVIKSVKSNEKIDMPTLLLNHMSNEQKISCFPIHEYWLDVGRMDDFELAKRDVEAGIF